MARSAKKSDDRFVKSRGRDLGGNIFRRIAVTGGLGFIGSAFIRAIQSPNIEILNIDVDTYAGDDRRLGDVHQSQVDTKRLDICDAKLRQLMKDFNPDVVVHFAAESHVTRSEKEGDHFHHTNVEGTRNVLQAATLANATLIIHVSTDEVYGPCSTEPFVEEKKLPGEGLATSQYARSKALADDLARTWTDADVIVVRPTNCFGPWQHPEKAIARWTTRALSGKRIPVWGDGQHVRDWMFVSDACWAILLLIAKGVPGNVYNLSPQGSQRTNLQIATFIASQVGCLESVYLSDYDRPQHDRRYAIDSSKIRSLGWEASGCLEQNLAATVSWYRNNRWWWDVLVNQAESIYDDSHERR